MAEPSGLEPGRRRRPLVLVSVRGMPRESAEEESPVSLQSASLS